MYPTDEDIEYIKNWNWKKIPVKDFIDWLEEHWTYANAGYFKLTGKKVLNLQLHTAGWSGNEDILYALSNTMFWKVYWQKSTRGEHHYFRIKL